MSRGVTLFWYQIDDRVVFERSDVEQLRLKENGQSRHAPLVKVLLEIEEPVAEACEIALKQLAVEIAHWPAFTYSR
ncbi:MAG: hypothetical protein ACLP9L_35360 [Thermoguttaceae bacterium]